MSFNRSTPEAFVVRAVPAAIVALMVAVLLRPLAAAEYGIAEFDMTFREEHVRALCVPVEFAGKEYRFQIDTGLSHTTFDSRLRPLLSRQTGRSKYLTMRGATRQSNYGAPPGIIGGVRLPPLNQVCCEDLTSTVSALGVRIDGVLGADALRGVVLQLDFDKKKILFLPTVPPDSGKGMRFMNVGGCPVITASLGRSLETEFVLDTGCNGQGTLSGADFATLSARSELLPAGEMPATVASGRFRAAIAVLKSPFSIAEYKHAGVVFAETRDVGARPNVLGLDFLSCYVVTLDFPHQYVYLKPSRSFDAFRPMADLGGVRLSRGSEGVFVLLVEEGSRAAQKACPNDMLEGINGVSPSILSDAEIVQRITSGTHERRLDFRRPSDGWPWWIILPAQKESATGPQPAARRRFLR